MQSALHEEEMMKIYLCQAKSTESRIPSIPYAQLALAAQIEDIADVRVSGYDEDGTHPGADKILKSIDCYQPDVVGITIEYAVAAKASLALAKKIRQYNRDIPIIAGGHHATFTWQEILDSGCVDAVFLGEGELSLRRFVEQGDYRSVPGVGYKKGSEYICTGKSELVSMDSLRPPAYHLLPNDGIQLLKGIESSRGCPYNCDFCETQNFFSGGKLRKMGTAQFMKNLKKTVEDTGGGNYLLLDDCFTADMNTHVRNIAEALKAEQMPVSIFLQGRVDNMLRHLDMMPLLADAGFKAVLLGVESIYQERLTMMNKKADYDRSAIRELINRCHDYGIAVWTSIVFGYPDETQEMIDETIEYLISLGVETANLTIATPIPGSALFERSLNENQIVTLDYDKFNGMNRILKSIPEKTTEWTDNARRKFFLRPEFIRRILGNVIDPSKVGIGSFMPAGFMSHSIRMPDQARPRNRTEWLNVLNGLKLVLNDFMECGECLVTQRVAINFDGMRMLWSICNGRLESIEFNESPADLECTTNGKTFMDLLIWCPLDIVSIAISGEIGFGDRGRDKVVPFIIWFSACQKVLRWAISMQLIVPVFRQTFSAWIKVDDEMRRKMTSISADEETTLAITTNDNFKLVIVWTNAERCKEIFLVSPEGTCHYDYECRISGEELDRIVTGGGDLLLEVLKKRTFVASHAQRLLITEPSAFFTSIKEKFIPEKAKNVDIGIQYEIRYDDTRQEDWFISIRDSDLSVGSGTMPDNSTATIRIEHPAFVELVNGKSTPFE
ncbi:MAG: radical SAM protein, partial [Chitinivibrionales bacterium]|nr:radical SAM protein [Chitinivibrionales bacterium]